MFYFFGLVYIALSIQRINDAAVFPQIIRPTLYNAISLTITTTFVLTGIISASSGIYLLISFFWLITSIYLFDNRRIYIIRLLTNVALVSIVLVKYLIELM